MTSAFSAGDAGVAGVGLCILLWSGDWRVRTSCYSDQRLCHHGQHQHTAEYVLCMSTHEEPAALDGRTWLCRILHAVLATRICAAWRVVVVVVVVMFDHCHDTIGHTYFVLYKLTSERLRDV